MKNYIKVIVLVFLILIHIQPFNVFALEDSTTYGVGVGEEFFSNIDLMELIQQQQNENLMNLGQAERQALSQIIREKANKIIEEVNNNMSSKTPEAVVTGISVSIRNNATSKNSKDLIGENRTSQLRSEIAELASVNSMLTLNQKQLSVEENRLIDMSKTKSENLQVEYIQRQQEIIRQCIEILEEIANSQNEAMKAASRA